PHNEKSGRFLAIFKCLKHLTTDAASLLLLHKLDDSSRSLKFADYLFRYAICFDAFDAQRQSKIPSEHLALYVSYNNFLNGQDAYPQSFIFFLLRGLFTATR
ncbi:MAG TPA: hypothetical protein VF893_07295, partial [Candidatus Bathyarchaeia archaeon]